MERPPEPLALTIEMPESLPVRIFLDANILFSAAWNPQGVAAFVIGNGGPQRRWLTSEYAYREALHNLHRKRPQAIPDLQALMKFVRLTSGEPILRLDIPLRDKDRPILAAAIDAEARFLITGDKRDFGSYLGRPELTGGVCVLTLALYRNLGASE